MEKLLESAALLILGGIIQFLIARFNKNKQERDSGLVSDYIKITDMTGAQLERKINQVDKLEAKVEAIEKSREESQVNLKAALIESRDIRIDNIEKGKRITKLEETIAEIELRHKNADKKYRVVTGVAQKLIRALQNNDPPIAIPDLNGDLIELGDSARDLKLTPEQREALKKGSK